MAEGAVSSVSNQLIGKIFSSIIWVIIVLAVIGIVGGVLWYKLYYRRKFDIKVFIKSQRAEDGRNILEDWAAILYDRKTNTKFLRLLDVKVDLPVPPYGALQKTDKGDLLEIWRKSDDEFIYLLPSRIDKFHFIRQDGTQYTVADRDQKQLEGDIAYWNVKRKDKNKSVFSPDSLFMKLLPFIPQIIGSVLTLFMLYVLMDHMPQILQQLTELVKEMRSLKSATIIPA